MPIDDKMTVNERRKYLKLMSPRYRKARRVAQSALLTEMETVTGLYRESLLRLLHASSLERAPRGPRLRRRTYDVLQVITSVCIIPVVLRAISTVQV